MNKTKIFKHNLNNNSKKIGLRRTTNQYDTRTIFPSFTREWKTTIYSFDKKILSNIPTLMENINKIIRSYLDLFFKDYKFADMPIFVLLKRRRNFLRKIFSSRAEIRYINSKAIITLYILNREREFLKEKYMQSTKLIKKHSLRQFFLFYKKKLTKIHRTFNLLNNKYVFLPSIMRKDLYLKSKVESLNKLKRFKSFYIEKIWTKLIDYYLNLHFEILRKNSLVYYLNSFKFNKLNMLWVLTTILNKINILKNKKIEYNIINLKYVTNHPDFFTDVLALRLKRNNMKGFKEIAKILKRTNIPIIHNIKERTFIKSIFKSRLKEPNIFNYLFENRSKINQILTLNRWGSRLHNIYTSVKYKNIVGIKVEIKGRLTKRYRADRSIYLLRWKGGLKNIDSSFKRKSVILLRGNVKPNTAYSMTASKRRIGAFAVKGWIAGK